MPNSRSQLRNVESGATTICGQRLSSKREAKKAMLCIVLPAFKPIFTFSSAHQHHIHILMVSIHPPCHTHGLSKINIA